MVPISTALFNHEIKAVVVTGMKRNGTKGLFMFAAEQSLGRKDIA